MVTSVKVSGKADCPVLPEMLEQTRVCHRVQEVSADKAYLAKYNLAVIAGGGAEPYIPFKDQQRRHGKLIAVLAEDVARCSVAGAQLRRASPTAPYA